MQVVRIFLKDSDDQHQLLHAVVDGPNHLKSVLRGQKDEVIGFEYVNCNTIVPDNTTGKTFNSYSGTILLNDGNRMKECDVIVYAEDFMEALDAISSHQVENLNLTEKDLKFV